MCMIKIAIMGYGNVARGVEKAVLAAPDMQLRAVFTRRDPQAITDASAPVYSADDIDGMADEIDVLVLCGGTATDLRTQGPKYAAKFNVVDSFDTHSKIPEYMAEIDAAARSTTAIISTGWDPGLFSMMRALFASVLGDGTGYTFWGRGVSQGHSNAIRQIDGVKNAVQYTVPIEDALESVRRGENPELTPRQKMMRECYVVAQPDADKAAIEHAIKTMPDYFADYDTTVEFISEAQLHAEHGKTPHGGTVLHSGRTDGSNKHVMEFKLALDSNPEFTGSVMVAYARACARLAAEGQFGAKTVFDVPLWYLSPKDRQSLIKELL